MRNFKAIEKDIKNIESVSAGLKMDLLKEALEVMTAKLSKRTDLTEYLGRLESSKDLTSDGEFPARWIRFDASQFIDEESELEREVFALYMDENHSATVDFKHDSLQTSDGPCLIITEDGSIYDQDSAKIVIPADDTKDEETGDVSLTKRNQLIEQWMTAKGYFPSVIREDRHGNMFYVNIQEGD